MQKYRVVLVQKIQNIVLVLEGVRVGGGGRFHLYNSKDISVIDQLKNANIFKVILV